MLTPLDYETLEWGCILTRLLVYSPSKIYVKIWSRNLCLSRIRHDTLLDTRIDPISTQLNVKTTHSHPSYVLSCWKQNQQSRTGMGMGKTPMTRSRQKSSATPVDVVGGPPAYASWILSVETCSIGYTSKVTRQLPVWRSSLHKPGRRELLSCWHRKGHGP